jgi:hypothetical protein
MRLARRIVVWCAAALVAAAPALASAGIPDAYQPIVIEPAGYPQRAEFDLSRALERAKREGKSLYIYLGADDCRYCRRYEAFLEHHAAELVPHFRKDWIVVDLRSNLSMLAKSVFLRVGETSRNYGDFQAAIGDARTRLVYPSVWLLDAAVKPLMQMPTGAGTFETVAEQLEILRLEN